MFEQFAEIIVIPDLTFVCMAQEIIIYQEIRNEGL